MSASTSSKSKTKPSPSENGAAYNAAKKSGNLKARAAAKKQMQDDKRLENAKEAAARAEAQPEPQLEVKAELKVEVKIKASHNRGIGKFAVNLIKTTELGNSAILEQTKAEFPGCNTSYACIAWYRNALKNGKIS